MTDFRRALGSMLCSMGLHRGPVVGEGLIVCTAKKNHAEVPIAWGFVRRCEREGCGEIHSRPEDLAS